jgi:hypothetical protein
MEKNKKTLLLTLALIFIGMFLLASVFAAGDSREGNPQTLSNQVTQTYKSYETTKVVEKTTYKTYESTKITEVTITPTRTSRTTNWNDRPRYSCDGIHCSYERTPINTIHYTQYGTQETRKSFLGDYVKEYSAYVTNRGKTGRYFTVKFNFEDKNGYEFSQSITQYLKTGEQKKFVYKDIQYERNEILHWNYEIIPQKY